ncbi:MAG TPA: alpha/beta hydrolase [Pseudonocardia sp.]|jgi:pimeloyl-ACP methyl ester carboxylesterase|nr:alpha/beta hydrolase [Pseudonocardia sp.]
MAETYVLIPGAWHGGWAWRPVAQRLRAAGHRVVSLTMPGLADGSDPRGLVLGDAVAHVVGEVTRLDLRDVTLVAHSWGGMPMTGAAHQLTDRVRKLVYWSAFVPDGTHSLIEEVPNEFEQLFTQVAVASGDNTVTLPYEVWSQGFIQDAEPEVRRLVYELLVPQPMGYFTEALGTPEIQTLGIPATYLISTDDLVFPPGEYGWVPRFPDRLGVEPTEVPGSHESMLTQPAELAEAILKA